MKEEITSQSYLDIAINELENTLFNLEKEIQEYFRIITDIKEIEIKQGTPIQPEQGKIGRLYCLIDRYKDLISITNQINNKAKEIL